MLSGIVRYGNARQGTVGILCHVGAKVGESKNEVGLGQTTEADREECGKGAVGQEAQGETVSHYERGQKSGNLCEMLNGGAAD
jgi:hypothetical protein